MMTTAKASELSIPPFIFQKAYIFPQNLSRLLQISRVHTIELESISLSRSFCSRASIEQCASKFPAFLHHHHHLV